MQTPITDFAMNHIIVRLSRFAFIPCDWEVPSANSISLHDLIERRKIHQPVEGEGDSSIPEAGRVCERKWGEGEGWKEG